MIPIVEKKSEFEQSLSKLDLQGCLLLISILSEKALILSQPKKTVLDAKGL